MPACSLFIAEYMNHMKSDENRDASIGNDLVHQPTLNTSVISHTTCKIIYELKRNMFVHKVLLECQILNVQIYRRSKMSFPF